MKYLIVTLRDNDFTSEGRELGILIQSLLFNELEEPEEIIDRINSDTAEFLKEKIAILWSTAHDFWMNLRFNDCQNTKAYMLKNLQLLIWDDKDIEEELECPNAELIVIPLSYNKEPYVL